MGLLLLTVVSLLEIEEGVEKVGGHRQERLPVAPCGASPWDESGSECTPVLGQHVVEGVGGIVQDDAQLGQRDLLLVLAFVPSLG